MNKSNNGGTKMKYTQNEKILQVNEKALVIGADIASEIHYASALTP